MKLTNDKPTLSLFQESTMQGTIFEVYRPNHDNPAEFEHDGYLVTEAGNINRPLAIVRTWDSNPAWVTDAKWPQWLANRRCKALRLAQIYAHDTRFIHRWSVVDLRRPAILANMAIDQAKLAKVGSGLENAVYRCNPKPVTSALPVSAIDLARDSLYEIAMRCEGAAGRALADVVDDLLRIDWKLWQSDRRAESRRLRESLATA